MARLFDDASNQCLWVATPALTSVPLTMACWFNSDNLTASQVLMDIRENTVNTLDDGWHLGAAGHLAGDPVAASTRQAGAGATATSTTGFSANTWHHACGVFVGNAERYAYIDGGSKGTDTGAKIPNPGQLSHTAIGAILWNPIAGYMSGMIAEAAIWDAALTDEEVAILAKCYSPLFVRPQNLICYWPLIRGHANRVDGIALGETASAPTVASHPRIRYPHGQAAGIAR